MNRCEDCRHAGIEGDANFVRCYLRLPSWVAAHDSALAGNHMVLKGDQCSFFEHKNAWMASTACASGTTKSGI